MAMPGSAPQRKEASLLAAGLALTIGCAPPPPSLDGTVVEIVPASPQPGEALVAAIRIDSFGVGEEEFTYLYRWTVDGQDYPDDGGRRVEAGETTASEVWRVTVTPELEWFDEILTGPAATDSATVLAAPAPDGDGDGFDGPTGDGADCDDADAAVFPGAPESCDGRDEDCNGVADDTADLDFDGVFDCDDCDDSDPGRFPGNPEACNGLDDDCDGVADEDMPDADGDGFDACQDCDDGDAGAFPGNVESCEVGGPADQVDDDCVPGNDYSGMLYWFRDDDGDGFGESPPALFCGPPPDGYSATGDDCDDDAAAVHPGMTETCNGLDDDCDPATDESADGDGDARTICGGDCDDSDPAISPDVAEIPLNLVDDDCDGQTDE